MPSDHRFPGKERRCPTGQASTVEERAIKNEFSSWINHGRTGDLRLPEMAQLATSSRIEGRTRGSIEENKIIRYSSLQPNHDPKARKEKDQVELAIRAETSQG